MLVAIEICFINNACIWSALADLRKNVDRFSRLEQYGFLEGAFNIISSSFIFCFDFVSSASELAFPRNIEVITRFNLVTAVKFVFTAKRFKRFLRREAISTAVQRSHRSLIGCVFHPKWVENLWSM